MCTKILKKNINVLKTISIYLSMLSLGLSISITGPCFLDLQRLVNTDIQQISFIFTSRSLGYLVGAILGGIVLDLVRSKMLIMAVCNIFTTVTMFGMPWSRNVETLLSFAVINGLSLGAIETGSNVVIINIWGSGPVLQALHFTFGLGSLISPLIAAPFLEDEINLQNLSNTTNYSSNAFLTSNAERVFSSNEADQGIAKITYPFSIVGIFSLLVTILFFITSLISPYEDSGSQNEGEDNSDKSRFFMFNILVFSFLAFFVIIGTEIAFGQTLATYAVKGKLLLTAAVASYMTSTYWTAFMIARLICAFLSIKFSSLTLLIGDICLITMSGVMFLFLMPNEKVLWMVVVLYGIGTASTYASLYGWLADYIKITNKICALLTVACAAGEMVIPFIITFFMETVPEMLAYVINADSIISVILVLILHAIIKKGEKKFRPKEIECYVVSKEYQIS